jgi:MFS family permease
MSAAVADVVSPADRGNAYSLLYWVINLGSGLAMLFAGLLVERGFVLLFFTDAATTLAYALIVFLRVPETRPARTSEHHPLRELAAPFSDGAFILFVAISLGLLTVFCQIFATLPLDMRRHGLPAASYGALMAINCFLVAVTQPFIGAAAARRDHGAVLALGGALFAVGFGATALATTAATYAATIVVWTFGEMLLLPTAHTVIADLAPAERRGGYQGLYGVTWSVATIVGPLLGGAAAGTLGYPSLWLGCMGLATLGAGGHWLLFAPRLRARVVKVAAAEASR